MTKAAIVTEDLTKYFGAVVGVEGLSLSVERGEVFGFLGANGAGKTTTIRLLVDLLRPTRGRASILGHDCHRRSLDARRLLGYLPGETPIYPELTGRRYLTFLTRLNDRPVTAGALERLLRRFDVSDADLRRRLRDYSHGMRRKLDIIQGVMTGAPVLILDEPTSGLDPLMIEAFGETLHELRRDGITIFLSSHVLSEVERTCDRIGLVRGGRLVSVRPIDEIRRTFPRRLRVEFSHAVNGSVALVAGARFLERSPTRWVVQVEGPLGPVIAALGALPVVDLHVEPFRLEDYVLGLYAE